MKKLVLLTIVSIAGILLIAGLFFWSVSTVEKNSEYVDRLHLKMDPGSIPELMEIIRKSPDNDARERAMFVLTDISLNASNTEGTVQLFKDIALTEENDDVRTAAYTNLYHIRSVHPPESRGTLEVRIQGNLREGSRVTLIATVSSSVDVGNALTGIQKIADKESSHTDGITLNSSHPMPLKLSLKAGVPQEIPFTLDIHKKGLYKIVYVLILQFDRVDSEEITKEILIDAGKDSGKYRVENPE